MVFMKGAPDAPRCGFSRTLVGLLREEEIDFDSFDILEDQDVRQGLKELSNWPTYPQVRCCFPCGFDRTQYTLTFRCGCGNHRSARYCVSGMDTG